MVALFALSVCSQCVLFQPQSDDNPAPFRPFVLEDEIGAVREILSANAVTDRSPYDLISVDQAGHVTDLYLDYCGLRLLPDNLHRLPLLGNLRIEGNRLTDLPDLALPNLRALYLDSNRLCHVSALTQGRLDSLQKLERIPAGWLERQKCREDYSRDSLAVRAILDANGLPGVPVPSVVKRRGDIIRSLNLNLRKLDTLPASIGELEWLETLYLAENRIASLPPEIGSLGHLAVLRLGNNRLDEIPASLCGLAGLDTLGIEDNRLASLPGCLTASDSLAINVDHNRICQVPQALIDWLFAHADPFWQRSQTCEVPVGFSADSLIVQEMLDASKAQLTVREIATVRKGRITKLSMSSYGPLLLTDNLAKLDSLDTLEIRHSPLTRLPASIGDFRRLKTLSIYESKLDSLPAEIGRLRTLETLSITIGSLKALPPALSDLIHLKELHLAANGLISVPDWFGKMTALETVDLSQNGLTAIHSDINKCANLKSFQAEFNHLPEFVFRPASLPKLEKLSLRGNSLTTLPVWITGFGNRALIELSGNALCDLDPAISAWIAANPSVRLEHQNCGP